MAGQNRDDDRGGFPDDLFEQMHAGHKRFLRDHEDSGRRFQHDNQERSGDGSGNFFTFFKGLVDNHLSSLKDSFRSFPGNVAELKAKMQEDRGRRKQEELDIWRKWTGIAESPDGDQLERYPQSPDATKEAVDAALMLLREANKRNAHVSPEKVLALYNDNTPFGGLDRFAEPMLSPGGACYYQRDSGYNAPSTTNWIFGTPNYRWLSIDWFKRSPYSPISLEAQYGEPGGLWRMAFEDLLNAALDKPMDSYPQIGTRIPHGKPQSTHFSPGLDWMLSLQCRGILPPQLPRLYQKVSGPQHLQQAIDEALRGATCKWNIADLAHEIATPAPESGFERDPNETFTEMDVADAQNVLDKIAQVYQDQLMVLEEQNKERLMKAKAEQAAVIEPSPTASTQAEPWVRALTGARHEDLVEATTTLADAFDHGNLRAAMETLNDWHDTYGDLEALVKPLYKYRSEMWDYVERLEQESDALQSESMQAAASKADAPATVAASSKSEAKVEKVDVLSSLTTTQTTRLPDGTTTTKVMLKQRFADGREEIQEKVHTHQEAAHELRQAADEPEQESSQKHKGWFWS